MEARRLRAGFPNEPAQIVQEKSTAAGSIDSVHVVVDGHQDAAGIEMGVIASPGIEIIGNTLTEGQPLGWGIFDPTPRHSRRHATTMREDTYPAGPCVFSTNYFMAHDAEPDWIKLSSLPVVPGGPPGRPPCAPRCAAGDHTPAVRSGCRSAGLEPSVTARVLDRG